MGKGRAPCCDKSKVKKGPWSPAEDLRLITFIQKHGHENWRALPKQAGLLRCGKSCRLRWINYLRPDVKRGNFTKEEEDTIIKLHQTLGNKWSKIASHLPGRTDNEIKNVWNTHLKKKMLVSKKDSHSTNDSKESSSITTTTTTSTSSSSSSNSNANMGLDDRDHDHDHQCIKKKPRVSYNNDQEEANNKVINDQDHHQMGNSVFDFSSTEVNKPEFDQVISTADIPFESDFDFWNMLDGLSSNNNNTNSNINDNNTNYNNNQNDNNNNNNSQSSSSIEEDENRKWLKYLESELGLENGGNKDHLHNHHQSLAEDHAVAVAEAEANLLENFQYEIMPMKPETINYEMGYYHLWPSL